VREWAGSYDFARLFTTHLVFVAKVDREIVAWAALIPPRESGVAVLDDLWVEPAWIGKGVGSSLFATAREQARRLGAETLEWEAELNAIGFYERMGGRYLRQQIGDWGSPLPVMGIDLAERVGNGLPGR
jgi:GNAT superfamily N-acetyltransferase